MKLYRLLFFFLLLAAPLFGQGFAAGGYAYNAREDDHAAWVEVGANVYRFGVAVDMTKWVSDPFRFREVALLGRYRVVSNFELEAGYGMGAVCFAPQIPNSCEFHGTIRTRTPIVGVEWLSPKTLVRLQPLIRMDFTRWQLPPTHGKDDGFRLLLGVRWPKQ